MFNPDRRSELLINFSRTTLAGSVLLGGGGLAVKSLIDVVSADAQENQPCVRMGYEGDTIRNNGLDTTTFKAEVMEACRSGLLRVDGDFIVRYTIDGQSISSRQGLVRIPLKDDGTGQDERASDWIYTSGKITLGAQFPLTYQGIEGLGEDGAINSIRLVYADRPEERISPPRIFIMDKNIPLVSSNKRSDTVQTTDHIINIRDDVSAVAQILGHLNGDQDMRGLVNNLYGLAPETDPYRMLMMTNDKRIFLKPPARQSVDGLNTPIRRDFIGTGATGEPQDAEVAKLFGSQGNLRHIIFLPEPVVFLDAFHEMTHWGAVQLDSSLGLGSGHWGVNHSAGGLVGGTTWRDNGDGTFTTLGPSHQFLKMSKLEQYLWGLIRPIEVPPTYVALDQNQRFDLEGTKIHGPFKVITVQDIIAAHGPRIPGPDSALRHLKMGYLYTTTGRLATPQEMTARELIAQRLPVLWQSATEGQSTMEFVTPKEAPKIIEPYAGRTLESLANRVKFQPLPGAKWAHWQVIPANNDGPGVNLLIGDSTMIQKGEFNVPAPVLGQGPYIMLPGQGYTERVRTSDKDKPDVNRDEDWSGWAVDTFRTPPPTSATIEPVTANGTKMPVLNPVIQWKDNNKEMFYYEFQLSKDPTFNTDPQTATARIYGSIIHGGVSIPLNSYRVPAEAPLEVSTTYYWRARQRVQGDGQPVSWSPVWIIKTSEGAKVQKYSPELVDKYYGRGIWGPSEDQYDQANPIPEAIPSSSLATWRLLGDGTWLFDPGTGAPEIEQDLEPVA